METVVIQHDAASDEYYIVSDMFERVGWKPGDTIIWTELEGGGWSLQKKEEDESND